MSLAVQRSFEDPGRTRLARNESVRFTLQDEYADAPTSDEAPLGNMPPEESQSPDDGRSRSSSAQATSQRTYASSDRSLQDDEHEVGSDATQILHDRLDELPDQLPDQSHEGDHGGEQSGEGTYRMRHGWDSQYREEQLKELTSNFYLYYNDKRHERRPPPDLLTAAQDTVAVDWRMRDRLKTVVSVICLCLNIGVDPPDSNRTNPAAKLECWVDPFKATSPNGDNVALSHIAKALESQYQQLSIRTKYKVLTDPSIDETKKLTSTLRKNVRDERMMFHYNGHGTPQPTASGEIWVFNKDYTQYIPITLIDLQSWMGAPSIYVWECHRAGLIVNNFLALVNKREHENQAILQRDPNARVQSFRDCIHLGACSADDLLPVTPQIPADLFTCCLTTPIEIAIRYFLMKNPLPSQLAEEDLSHIPGKAQERRTPIGELNWIFTAITDTIAWNSLPRSLFKKLFRQDLMVAALFRNFLLAQRIMRSFNCHPVSYPDLPTTHDHPLWASWDLAVELVLMQLPELRKSEAGEITYEYQHSEFFAQQLTAFSLYLEDGAPLRKEPEQLPIVLQVLLSQVHRVRALVLLSRFLDFGPWAVHLALSIGIFPYVLKLLQSQASELKPSLIFIWTRILAVDQSCQADLHKDNGYQYFVSVLQPNAAISTRLVSEHRAMCAFILAMFCRNNRATQQAALNSDVLRLCLQYTSISDAENPLLRQWCCLCLSTLWDAFPDAKYSAIKYRAHLRLSELASDPVPEVRTSMLTAMTTLLGLPELVGSVQEMEEFIVMSILPMCDDGSSFVRKEMVVLLGVFVELHRDQMIKVASGQLRDEIRGTFAEFAPALAQDLVRTRSHSAREDNERTIAEEPSEDATQRTQEGVRARRNSDIEGRDNSRRSTTASIDSTVSPQKHARFADPAGAADERPPTRSKINGKASASSSTASSAAIASSANASAMTTIWRHVQYLSVDPDDDIARCAAEIVDSIEHAALEEGEGANAMAGLLANMRNLLTLRELLESERRTRRQESSRRSSLHEDDLRPNLSRRASDLSGVPTDADAHSGPRTASPTPRSRASSTMRPAAIANPEPQQLLTDTEENGADGHRAKQSQRPPSPQEEPQPRFHPSQQVSGGQQHERFQRNVSSDFFNWSKEYFTEPQMRIQEVEEPGSPEYDERITRRAKSEAILDRTQIMKDEAGSSRWDRPYGHFDNASQPTLMVAHQYEDHLAVADKANTIRIWDWSKQTNLNTFSNGNWSGSKITGMKYANEDDPHALLLVGSNDGAVKFYANYWSQENCYAATAFRGNFESRPRDDSGRLVFDWIQTRGQLLVVGDSKDVQVWTVASELVSHDIPLGTSAACTTLTTDQLEGNTIITGFEDGSVRVYDQRTGPGAHIVNYWHEHTAPIITTHLQRGGQRELVSGSCDGVVKLWDIRMQKSLLTIRGGGDRHDRRKGITRCVVHEHAPVLACGSHRGSVRMYNTSGEFLSACTPLLLSASNSAPAMPASTNRQTSTTDGPSPRQPSNPTSNLGTTPLLPRANPKFAPIAALAFHPHRMVLATASVGESNISLFTCNEDKFKLDERIWLNRKHRTAAAASGDTSAGWGQGIGTDDAKDRLSLADFA